MDPFHVAFLHTRVSGPQFSEVFATLPTIDYHETERVFFQLVAGFGEAKRSEARFGARGA